jgi:adenosine deaminase
MTLHQGIGCLLLGLCVSGQLGVAQNTAEQRTVRAFAAASKNPLTLRVFLQGMPKGGDLHLHMSGGTVYSETLIRDAVQDGLCVKTATMTLIKPQGACGEGAVPAANALKDQNLYDAMVNAFSMRYFVPSSGISGHDQFFATFDRFEALGKAHDGEWVDEIATRAQEQNEQYIEAMYTPSFAHAAKLGYQIGWSGDSAEDLKKTYDALLAGGLRDEIATDRQELDEVEKTRAQREHCGEPQAKPACSVKVLYLYQVLRGFPPQQVFAQTLLGFELASVDPRVVGYELCDAGRWLPFHARLSPAHEDAGLSPQHLSQGAHDAARGRAVARDGAAGRVEVPYTRGCRAGPRGTHRSRGRCDV